MCRPPEPAWILFVLAGAALGMPDEHGTVQAMWEPEPGRLFLVGTVRRVAMLLFAAAGAALILCLNHARSDWATG